MPIGKRIHEGMDRGAAAMKTTARTASKKTIVTTGFQLQKRSPSGFDIGRTKTTHPTETHIVGTIRQKHEWNLLLGLDKRDRPFRLRRRIDPRKRGARADATAKAEGATANRFSCVWKS